MRVKKAGNSNNGAGKNKADAVQKRAKIETSYLDKSFIYQLSCG